MTETDPRVPGEMPQGQRLEVKSLQRLVFSRNIGGLLTYKA